MKLTNLAIKYRTTVVVLTLLLIVGGLFSYVTIPKEANPSIELATIVVTTVYPGASPEAVASNITEPIEQEIATINGIDEMRSTSSKGVSTDVVEFMPDVDVDKAYQEVTQAVDRAESEIPEAVEDPLVNEINFEDFPILTVNLAADYSLARLKDVAENLQEEIESVPNILEANLVGGLEREVQVRVDLSALKGHGLSFNDIIRAIRQENRNIPGGDIDVDRHNYLVRVEGEFENPARQTEDLVVKSTDEGRNVYVRDVADVVFGFKERQTYARLKVLKRENAEGEPVVVPDQASRLLPVISLNVTKESGASILETVDNVKAVIDNFDFPTGTQVTITGDVSTFIEDLLTDIENNVISGLIFVVLVLLFFLGVRNAALVGIAIPISMCVAFIFFHVTGYTLNFIILFSFIIALGLLVDSAIVIVENIYRWRENGYSRWEAARRGTGELGGAVVASVAVTLAAFAPMLFWPGIIGEFMGYLPLTLIIALTSALFVALVINPVITGYFVRTQEEEEEDEKAAGWRDWPKAARYLGAGAMLLIGLVLGFANWETLVVLVVAIPLVYYLYRWALKPVADRFRSEGLPRLSKRYRDFVDRMLERDYTPKRALLRNASALTAFAAGLVLLVLGGGIVAAVGLTAALFLLVPGGILFLAGLLGVLVHTFESIYLGGRTSVKLGGILFRVMVVILGISVASGALPFSTFLGLMVLPGLIVLVGLAGAVFNRRERLILTDNRARLITGAVGGLFLLFGLFFYAPTGQAFFPDTDPRIVQINLEAATGTTVETSNRLAMQVQDSLRVFLANNPASKANIKNVLVNVGVGGDAMFGGGAAASNQASITLTMVDFAERAEPSTRTLEKLRAQLQGFPGVDIQFTERGTGGPPTGPPVNIEISGPDFDRITQITREVKRMLTEAAETGRLPGLVDVESSLNAGRPVVRVDVDRVRAAQFGLSTSEIAQTVRTAIQGTEADTYRSGDDEYDITVRLQQKDRASLESLESLVITDADGVQIPLTAVADLEVGTGVGSITHIDQGPVATVSGDAAPGYNGPEVLNRVQDVLSDYRQSLPPGYSFAYTGGNEEQQESFGFLFTALLIGLSLIFMIMITQFNSVSAPFIIMIAVGLSLIGVFLGLILTRTPFNLFTFLGIISVAGIMANNNIVLIEYMLQLRQRGMDKHEAIIEAGATRLRPVLLAAISATIGLVPLTLGINIDFVGLLTDFDPNFQFGSANTQFWGPMGIAIISGLIFGTFITLVIIPSVYSVFDSVSHHLAGAFGKDSEAAGLVSASAGDGEMTAHGNGVGHAAGEEKAKGA